MKTYPLCGVAGGAVAGSEVASILASAGFPVVVFEKSPLPYGKIVDGLPKWHVGLRQKNIQEIDEKLSHPLILYVPQVEVGKDLIFPDVFTKWGFDLFVLAFGAYKDRPLEIEGIEKWLGKRIFYQNEFIYFFNNYHEEMEAPIHIPIMDNAIVIGGGLASIDVVKVLIIETVRKALAKIGKKATILELEKSISDFLKKENLTLADLGLKGPILTYRRRIQHMPITPTPSPQTRIKFATNLMEKYLFRIVEGVTPLRVLEKNGEFYGIEFIVNEVDESGNITPTDATTQIPASMAISSIGSIPVLYDGLPVRSGLYDYDPETYRLRYPFPVFITGNAATGRGNILASKKHAREIGEKYILPELKAKEETTPVPPDELSRPFWTPENPSLPEKHKKLLNWVLQHYSSIGYTNYREWKEKNYREPLIE